MPVNLLLVEGDLDQQLLATLPEIGVTVESVKAGKYALLSRTRFERAKHLSGVFYLRDRDFDHEPGDSADVPAVDHKDDDTIMGWRWYRHAIESYLLEPTIVREALGVSEADYTVLLEGAARDLRYYTAARWTIGLARSRMPRSWKLRTSRVKEEFSLPDDTELAQDTCLAWMLGSCATFLEETQTRLDEGTLHADYDRWCERLGSDAFSTPSNILLYFSGKDIMCRIAPRLPEATSPKVLRNMLRDWIREHPTETLHSLHEWRQLLRLLKES